MSLKIGEKSTFVMSFSPYQWATLTCFVWVVYQINLQIQKKNQMFALNQFSKHYYNFSHLDFDNPDYGNCRNLIYFGADMLGWLLPFTDLPRA